MKHGSENEEPLRTRAEALGTVLTPEAERRLLTYERLLRDRGVDLGVVSANDAPRLRSRHILDSLRAAGTVRSQDTDAYDLGSGGGLPGIVIATALPRFEVCLVETRGRRAAFLELVIERLELRNASVLASRIEDLTVPVDVCFARAVAPAAESWALAQRLLRPDGRLVYFAGDGVDRAIVVPEGAQIEVRETPVLESAGPLVIMTRQ